MLILCSFVGAEMTGAFFAGADMTGANLSQSRLTGSLLASANFSEADLSDADLSHAWLKRAVFRLTILARTNLADARMDTTIFGDTDLGQARGLDLVHHDGPSVIGIDTIFRSQGDINQSFLRGCGVPDEFIAYAKSLVAHPIQFYSCFISYSTNDQDFADRLYADLQNKGVRCWFAPHDVQGGRKLHEQIDEAIRLHDKLLLILSPQSMQSEWVKTEIAKARKREVRD